MPPWTDPAWRAEADAWIGEQLVRLGAAPAGEIDQLHVQPWSTVMRVPTDGGDLYFKANDASLGHEASLVELLASRRPDCVPPLLAVDIDRGWMLMADAGTKLRDLIASERELSRWLDVLPLYAGLQIDLMKSVNELVARGLPDLRLGFLPEQLEALLETVEGLPAEVHARLSASLPDIAGLCEELASFGVPETIQHDDLHDGQVYVRGNRYLLLDWGDACVTHPFFTMAVTLDGVIAWGVDDVEGSAGTEPFRDAYLAPFARVVPGADLVGACTIARRLGWICRAVNGHLGGAEPVERTTARLRMFLDGRV